MNPIAKPIDMLPVNGIPRFDHQSKIVDRILFGKIVEPKLPENLLDSWHRASRTVDSSNNDPWYA